MITHPVRVLVAAAVFLILCHLLWMEELEWSSLYSQEDDSSHPTLRRDDSTSQTSSKPKLKFRNPRAKGDEDDVYVEEILEEFSKSREELIEELRQACLPRLICELFAMDDKSSLGDSERALMTLITQTSLASKGLLSTRYHYAAHMGQLLVGIDGNSCHYFYPTCPLAGSQALQLARRIRIR